MAFSRLTVKSMADFSIENTVWYVIALCVGNLGFPGVKATTADAVALFKFPVKDNRPSATTKNHIKSMINHQDYIIFIPYPCLNYVNSYLNQLKSIINE